MVVRSESPAVQELVAAYNRQNPSSRITVASTVAEAKAELTRKINEAVALRGGMKPDAYDRRVIMGTDAVGMRGEYLREFSSRQITTFSDTQVDMAVREGNFGDTLAQLNAAYTILTAA